MADDKAIWISTLAEIEDLLRTAPSEMTLKLESPESFAWLGRATAAVSSWDGMQGVRFETSITRLMGGTSYSSNLAFKEIMIALHRARANLVSRTGGARSVALEAGRTFDYFDEIRKAIETARQDVFFIDRYLDADFVAKYLPQINTSAVVRLLTWPESIPKLLPSAQTFAEQSGLKVEIRTTKEIHDRFVIIDRENCYFSGGSFKDGARKSPSIVAEVVDALGPVRDTYEKLWTGAVTVAVDRA